MDPPQGPSWHHLLKSRDRCAGTLRERKQLSSQRAIWLMTSVPYKYNQVLISLWENNSFLFLLPSIFFILKEEKEDKETNNNKLHQKEKYYVDNYLNHSYLFNYIAKLYLILFPKYVSFQAIINKDHVSIQLLIGTASFLLQNVSSNNVTIFIFHRVIVI